MERTYTLAQIKQAFWSNFHCMGDVWFGYLGTEEENEESTQTEWQEFLEILNEIDEASKGGV